MTVPSPLIQIQNLSKSFSVQGRTLKALDDISLSLYPGEILGLVGESGCGKSTLGKILTRLENPTKGTLSFRGESLLSYSARKEIQIIFQDPYASLNPKMTIGEILQEPFKIHKLPHSFTQIDELLSLVNLPPQYKTRFPHELSGGQRQRIGIARALALKPSFIVCDEPVSALDVSVSAQILNLLKKLQQELGLTLLFIAHDLRIVHYLSSRTCVMYFGQLMELAPVEELYKTPLHPYTKALLSAIPIPDPKLERARPKLLLQGDIPSPFHPLKGCSFASRCPYATSLCQEERPKWREHSPKRFVSCHYA